MPAVPYRDLDAVFLDLGNTLVTMDRALLCRVLADDGIVVSPEAVDRAEAAARPTLSCWIASAPPSEAGRTFVVYVQTLLDGLGIEDPDAERAGRLVLRVRATIPTQRLWSQVLPGVPAALARLRAAGLRLVVVSNSDGTAEAGVAAAGLRNLVDGVVDSHVVGVEKPDPRIFDPALALAACAPERALHVGDLHAVDVIGARAAGLHAALLDPYGDWPTADCDRFADLTALAAHVAHARR
ncbi:MAG TPA: HAD family hydrolase [Candidatus Eisenbacteria bacterium]|nr:HAD family hydrolase [Candidatus Eisenbacteria bacterium]